MDFVLDCPEVGSWTVLLLFLKLDLLCVLDLLHKVFNALLVSLVRRTLECNSDIGQPVALRLLLNDELLPDNVPHVFSTHILGTLRELWPQTMVDGALVESDIVLAQ